MPMLLIHLSDIHFRFNEIQTAQDPNRHLRDLLLKDAEAMCKELNTNPTAILISGDIAYSGDKREYDFALKWLEDFCEKCGTTTASVFVIPGNHDVIRSVAAKPLIKALHKNFKTTDDKDLQDEISTQLGDEQSASLLYASIAAYNNFAQALDCSLLPPDRTIAKRNLILNDGSILRLLGLNSTVVSSLEDKKGILSLFVDTASFQISKENGVENVVLCHHPYSWLRLGDQLEDHMNGVARIQLFGHEHTNRIVMEQQYLRVSAGATQPDRQESEWQPGYNLIQVGVDKSDKDRYLDIRVHMRVLQSRPEQFVSKMNGSENVFQHKIKLDVWEPDRGNKFNRVDNSINSVTQDLDRMVSESEAVRSDPMSTQREISMRFFKLTLNQKSLIAGRLELFDDEDSKQPDFERFKRVFMRARERGLLDQLECEINAINQSNSVTNH